MSQPASNQNEPSKMKKLVNRAMDEPTKKRLPRAHGPNRPTPQQRVVPVSPSPERESRPSRYKFLPAFWTIASVISLGVNLVLIVILLIVLQMLGTIQLTADDQVSGLLGGLYGNFMKMDEANIRTNIHVEKEIPVQFALNVSGPTNVTLRPDHR